MLFETQGQIEDYIFALNGYTGYAAALLWELLKNNLISDVEVQLLIYSLRVGGKINER
jgi:hypothetical protein